MSKTEVMEMVGGFLSAEMEWDTCLQEDAHNPYDEEARDCADRFGALCSEGMNPFEAFVKAFFKSAF